MLASGRVNKNLPTLGTQLAERLKHIQSRLPEHTRSLIAIIFSNHTVKVDSDGATRVIQLMGHCYHGGKVAFFVSLVRGRPVRPQPFTEEQCPCVSRAGFPTLIFVRGPIITGSVLNRTSAGNSNRRQT